jgi:hypothetical protein
MDKERRIVYIFFMSRTDANAGKLMKTMPIRFSILFLVCLYTYRAKSEKFGEVEPPAY